MATLVVCFGWPEELLGMATNTISFTIIIFFAVQSSSVCQETKNSRGTILYFFPVHNSYELVFNLPSYGLFESLG